MRSIYLLVMPPFLRDKAATLAGVFLALLISAGSVLVILFGLVGSSGSTIFSGGFYFGTLLTTFVLTFRGSFSPILSDYLFASFLACITVSRLINGNTAEPKEWIILGVSLAAYPACRFIVFSEIKPFKTAFLWTTAVVVIIGVGETAPTLFSQWYDLHGKPIVQGFDVAATLFLASLGFLVIAAANENLTARRTGTICAILFFPVALFSASQVRFTFIAIACSVVLAAILGEKRQRKYILAIGVVMVLAIGSGLLARFGTTATSLKYAVEQSGERRVEVAEDSQASSAVARNPQRNQPVSSGPNDVAPVTGIDSGKAPQSLPAVANSPQDVPPVIHIDAGKVPKRPPSCSLEVNKFNSVAIRKALLRDAAYLIPSAGPFGLGLDSFMRYSCVPSTEVHNSMLQAAIEFGWLSAIFLILLVVAVAIPLLQIAGRDRNVRFAICCLAYVTAITFAHGRVSRDIALFAFLGLGASLCETFRRTGTEAEPIPKSASEGRA